MDIIEDAKHPQCNMETFSFNNQDHTLGAALREKVLNNDQADFAGYKQIHPMKRKIELCIVSDSPFASLEKAKDDLRKDVKKLKKGWARELENA